MGPISLAMLDAFPPNVDEVPVDEVVAVHTNEDLAALAAGLVADVVPGVRVVYNLEKVVFGAGLLAIHFSLSAISVISITLRTPA